ncbi:NAD(P)-dependent oxidoreductase [Peribacillus butanolivorans]|uniref:NAD(P)-dependent oxidoreductase n=1 Tax=Peribacillus butanolivorans TaxID=421767 RepID=A0ABM6XF12_9BACI|nr:NAD(P)-dependent oxidoreductase [Peribacillus butanolivorans]
MYLLAGEHLELKGILTVIAGGDPEVLEKARPVLEVMNGKIIIW